MLKFCLVLPKSNTLAEVIMNKLMRFYTELKWFEQDLIAAEKELCALRDLYINDPQPRYLINIGDKSYEIQQLAQEVESLREKINEERDYTYEEHNARNGYIAANGKASL